MRQLQQQITSEEFNELRAYRRRNTLQPNVWRSVASLISYQIYMASGIWTPPAEFIPTGQVDEAKRQRQREAAAEAALERQRQRQND